MDSSPFPCSLETIRSWGVGAAFDSALRAADSGGVLRASWDAATGLASGSVAAGGHVFETSFLVRARRPGFAPGAAPRVENRCRCPAGESGVVCFHMLAVAIVLARRAQAARTTPEAREAERAAARAARRAARKKK